MTHQDIWTTVVNRRFVKPCSRFYFVLQKRLRKVKAVTMRPIPNLSWCTLYVNRSKGESVYFLNPMRISYSLCRNLALSKNPRNVKNRFTSSYSRRFCSTSKADNVAPKTSALMITFKNAGNPTQTPPYHLDSNLCCTSGVACPVNFPCACSRRLDWISK
jgi:hypothetical protein